MKLSFSPLMALATLIFLPRVAFAQLTAVVVEEYDPAVLNPEWAPFAETNNLTTYRIYAELESPNDLVLELTSQPQVGPFGVASNCVETYFTTTTSWYNDEVYGAALGSNIGMALFPLVGSVVGDSWLTIGMESVNSPDGGTLFTLGDSNLDAAFNASNGVNFFASNSSVFSLPGNPNSIPTGPNNRVLLGQLTTDGAIAFGINVSVQIGGVPGTPLTIYTHGSCTLLSPGSLIFTSAPELGLLYAQEGADIYACTDPLACNYNPLATLSSPVCEYEGCHGCTDTAACNFWDGAVFDDGSCCYDNCLNLALVENLPVSYFELYDANGELLVTVHNGPCIEACMNAEIPSSVDVNSACFQWLTVELPSCCTSMWDWAPECQTFYDDCVFDGNNIAVNCAGATGGPAPQVLCLPNGDYTIVYFGLDWEIWNDDFTFNSQGIFSGQGFNIETFLAGCTDQDACNYNPDAEVDNGSCTYVELFAISGPATATEGEMQQFSYPGMEGSSFEWTVGAGLAITDGQGTSTITVANTALGESTVCVTETLANGCLGNEVCAEVNVVVSVSEFGMEVPKVYPNPAVNAVTIDSGDRTWNWVIVRDASGREVGNHQLLGRRILDVSGLAAGRYHLEFHGDQATAVVPLMVVK